MPLPGVAAHSMNIKICGAATRAGLPLCGSGPEVSRLRHLFTLGRFARSGLDCLKRLSHVATKMFHTPLRAAGQATSGNETLIDRKPV